MDSKTIKINEENYKMLLNIAAELQKQRGEKTSFDDALSAMKVEGAGKKNKRVSDFAGKWSKISDKEADFIIKGIYQERKVMSRRL